MAVLQRQLVGTDVTGSASTFQQEGQTLLVVLLYQVAIIIIIIIKKHTLDSQQ